MMLLTAVQVAQNMFEIALDCSPMFFVLVCFWWYSAVSGFMT